MALIVEDGTGKTDAQSYINVEYANAYFSARAIGAWTGSATVKEAAILRAMDYVETAWKYLGARQYPGNPQALEWPRVGIYDDQGQEIVGIPERLKRAVAEYAVRALTSPLTPDPVTNQTGLVKRKREKLGPIEEETEYTGAPPSNVISYPAADILLRGLVVPRGGRAMRA